MKTRLATLILVGLLAAMAGGATFLAAGGAFPDVTIPGLPDKGPCCLVRVHKISQDAVRNFAFGDPYVCKVGDKTYKVVRGPASLRMPLTSGGNPCDEAPKLIPDGSMLEAKGVFTRRLNDNFGHFIGTFTIRKDKAVLFKGTIETIDRISTHHKPFGTDPCDLKDHLQGWLVGEGVDRSVANYTLRALLEANIRPGTPKQDNLVPVSLDGVLIECH